MKKTLKDLTPRENLVLSATHSKGTLADICKRTNIARSSTEYILKKLLKNKFISFSLHGKRTYYYSNPLRYKESYSIMHPITSFGPITLYTGSKAIEVLWKEIAEFPNETRIQGIQPPKSFKEALKKSSKKTVVDVSQTITDKKFIIDTIMHENLARNIFKSYPKNENIDIAKIFTGRPEDNVKVSPELFDEKSDVLMINGLVFIIDWFKEVAIKIQNENIYNLFVSLYLGAKAHGLRYNQGKFIESLIEKNK